MPRSLRLLVLHRTQFFFVPMPLRLLVLVLRQTRSLYVPMPLKHISTENLLVPPLTIAKHGQNRLPSLLDPQ
ncbi:hypothetical protein B0H19DRAFT_1108910 [Mycena capillaripes]|nr:hypothetical protein B0H19DRAFT_1108910 [Mycena capillaripes]